MNALSQNIFSISHYSNENLTFHESNITSKVTEATLVTKFAAEKETATIHQQSETIHNELISYSAIDISRNINATAFNHHTLSDSNPSMQWENTTNPGIGFEKKHVRNNLVDNERDTNVLPLNFTSTANTSNHRPFGGTSETSATTDKSQFATNFTKENMKFKYESNDKKEKLN